MRRSALAFAAGIGVLAVSCTSETGILVAASGSSVEELEFQVAADKGGEWILDPVASGDHRDVRGRNLRSSPYELFLREEDPKAEPPLTVRVLAMGYVGGERRSSGLTEPQPFLRGEVLRRSLSLADIDPNAPALSVRQQSCYLVRVTQDNQKTTVKLHTDTDMDCDGYAPPADCDDTNDAVHPGATEICDGKDNNCDGVYAALSEKCYGRVSTGSACKEGTRGCHDAPPGKGLDPTCAVTAEGKAAADAYCREYPKCTGSTPLACVAAKVKALTESMRCEVELVAAKLCGRTVPLSAPEGATSCKWVVVDSGGWVVALSDPSSCTPTLTVKEGSAKGTGNIVLELFVNGKTDSSHLVQITLVVKSPTACSAAPAECEIL